MSKIEITLDAAKLRQAITERSYTNQNGEAVIKQEIKLSVFPAKETKVLKSGPGWQLVKSHLVAIAITDKNAKPVYVGEGVSFVNDAPQQATAPTPETSNDIPF